MIIVTTFDLRPYIGQRVVLSEIKLRRKSARQPGGHSGRVGRVALENRHGLFDGPIFVLRELTLEEYQTQLESEIGRPLTNLERIPILQYRTRFFDISVD